MPDKFAAYCAGNKLIELLLLLLSLSLDSTRGAFLLVSIYREKKVRCMEEALPEIIIIDDEG